MKPAPIPPNEEERLATLRSYEILDTPAESAFDSITRLASQILDVPISVVALVDKDRQWFKSLQGEEALLKSKAVHGAEGLQTPRDTSFCSHVILDDEPMVVEDASLDPRFSGNPAVLGQPGIRFFAGVPIKVAEGYNLGSLCLIDLKPRQMTQKQTEILQELALLVVHELETRRSINRSKPTSPRRHTPKNWPASGNLPLGSPMR